MKQLTLFFLISSFFFLGFNFTQAQIISLPCLKCPFPDPSPDPVSSPDACTLDWLLQGLSQVETGTSNFEGTGSASANISNFYRNNTNGWINYVVGERLSSNPNITLSSITPTYEMFLQLGNTPYTIIYKAPYIHLINLGNGYTTITVNGLLEVYVSGSVVYSSILRDIEGLAVFRMAKEGNIMHFYKNNSLIPIPTTVIADTGNNINVAVKTDRVGKIRVSISSPTCQELIPNFDITSTDCSNSGMGDISVSGVQGGTIPYVHYFDNVALTTTQAVPSPTVGWITTVDQDYRASTYYMGVGKIITWNHTGTQLNNNELQSTSSTGFSIPSNTLSSSEDGWIGFRIDDGDGWSVGFIDAITSSALYEFKANDEITSSIYIGGVQVATVQALLTDYLRISKEGTQIKFYVNEVEVYSQSLLSSVDLKAKFGFTQTGATISYPTLSFCTPIDPPVITLASTDLSACQYDNVPVITPITENVTELRWYTTNPDGVSIPPIDTDFSFDPDAISPGSLAAGTYTYYVTGVGLGGQETAAQAITLTIYALPFVSINTPAILCPNSSITLTASAQASTSTYQWFKGDMQLTGETTRYLTLSQNGIYKVKVTTVEGCIAESERSIQQLDFTLNLSYNTSSSGCGQIYLKTTSSINDISYTYQKKTASNTWINQNTYFLNIFGATPNDLVPINQSGVYRIVSTYQTCTVYSNEIPVTIYPSTYSIISPTSSVCEGVDVTLSVENYVPSYNYQWQKKVNGSWINAGITQSIIIPHVMGVTNFKVITTDPVTGCSSTTSRTISYLSSPTITYTSFIEAEIGDPVNFNVSGAANYTYQWTYPNGSVNANPPITVTATSYGEYTLTVSYENCQTIYTAIIAEKGVFATLKENLDASYYHTSEDGKLYFKFDEKYGIGTTGLVSVSIFNYDFQEINQISLSKEYGYNWYELDLSSFGVEGDQYVLHIQDELDRRYVLRIKYVTGNNEVIIGDDFTTCISQSNDLRTVSLDAMSYVDNSPYSIYWYVSTDNSKINNLENLSTTEREALLFAEEQNIDQQYSTTLFSTQQNYLNQNLIYAPSEGIYYVRAKIKNSCNEEEVYSTQVVIITINLDASCRVAANEIIPEETHRFEIFFSIKRLFSPKPDTNSTVR